jgi:hypothetical protein
MVSRNQMQKCKNNQLKKKLFETLIAERFTITSHQALLTYVQYI